MTAREVRMKTRLKMAIILSFSRMEASWSLLTLPKVSRLSAPAFPIVRMELMPEIIVMVFTSPSAPSQMTVARKSWSAASPVL